jgi:cell division protein DivIC
MNRLLNHIPGFLKSKYLISFAAFCVVILFLDKNDLFTQMSRRHELGDLQESKRHYTSQIATERKELEALETNPAAVEKVAREKYLMKRDNEEIFLISEKPDITTGKTKN